MAGTRAFEIAIDLAVRRRDGARTLLVQARAQQRNVEAQLNELSAYARETRQRWGPRENALLLPVVLHHQTQFLARLDQTMGLQQRVVLEHQHRTERAVQALATAEARVASLRQVLKQREREAALLEERREQRQTDEFAMQRHARGIGRQLTQGI